MYCNNPLLFPVSSATCGGVLLGTQHLAPFPLSLGVLALWTILMAARALLRTLPRREV